MSTSSLLSGSSFSCALAPCSFTSSLSSEQGRRGGERRGGGGGEGGEEEGLATEKATRWVESDQLF